MRSRFMHHMLAGLVAFALTTAPFAHAVMAYAVGGDRVAIQQQIPQHDSQHMLCTSCMRNGPCVFSCCASASPNGSAPSFDGAEQRAIWQAGVIVFARPIHRGHMTRAPPQIPILI